MDEGRLQLLSLGAGFSGGSGSTVWPHGHIPTTTFACVRTHARTCAHPTHIYTHTCTRYAPRAQEEEKARRTGQRSELLAELIQVGGGGTGAAWH